MLVSIPAHLGYGALFGFVFAESAGVPLPGETALVAAGLLAGSGQLALPAVIAVGTVAAVLGDNLGYWFGRRGGRALLLRDGRFARHRRKAVEKAVWGMLPKNRLGRTLIKKLMVYAGPDHPHAAQTPAPFEFKQIAQ